MGETIEQYRARIGTHNDIKRCPNRHNARCFSTA